MSHSGKHRHAGKAGAGAPIRRRVPLWLAAGVLVLGVAACAPIYRDHGYVPTQEELAAVEVGKDTRETVAEKVGRPSTSGLLNDVGWFYVQSRWKHYGAKAPQEIDRQVVSITFTDAGVVQNVERFGLEDGQVVTLSRRITDTNIKGVSFIRQIMGNLGRMRAADIVN
mgnify:CR=1 FL=1